MAYLKNEYRAILRHASWLVAPFGVLAFWVGMVMAAERYPSEYDWRYMPISHLLSPVRDPVGYGWAWTGMVLYSVCGLCWTALLSRKWRQARAEDRLSGIQALQFGYSFAIGAGVLPDWLLRVERGHEILTLLAFGGLCVGMIRLMFQTIDRTLMRQLRRFTDQARLFAGILASAAVLPIVLAAFAQIYVYYALPGIRWVNLSWRARGVPAYLSFDFWEWVTVVMISAYTVILSLATRAVYHLSKGKEDILGSAFLVTQRILHADSIFQQHEQIRRSTPNAEDCYEAEVVIPNDGDDEGHHACNSAMDMQGKRFPFNAVPDLPLPKCDAAQCRCMFRYLRK